MSNESNKRFYLLKILFWTFLILFTCLGFFFATLKIYGEQIPVFLYEEAFCENNGYTVILDAGHGGIDSGTVSKSGIFEKDINLDIANKIGVFLQNEGINVVYTRTEDQMLTSEEKMPTRKQSDLTGRLEIVKKTKNPLFVSIHQNALCDTRYSGLQVFYSKNNILSKSLAIAVQNDVKNNLQKDNHREVKESGSNIFLLDRIESPAILIECGFLSNEPEAERLADESYRDELAFIISNSILSFCYPEK